MIRRRSGTQICILILLVNDTQNVAVPKNMTIIIRSSMRIDLLSDQKHITISVKRKGKPLCSAMTEIKVDGQKS